MKKKKHSSLKARYIFIGAFTALAVGVLIGRLVEWQIVQSDYYDEIAAASASYTVESDGIRGEIFDKNGVPLAVNETSYKVVMNKLFIPESRLNDAILRAVEAVEGTGGKWIDSFPVVIDKNGDYAFDKDKSESVARMKSKDKLNMNPYSTAGDCMAILAEKYDCKGYDKKQTRDIASVRYNMEESGYSYTKPYIFADGLSEVQMLDLSEKLNDIKGISVESYAVRTYKNGTSAPHIVGVTGLISESEYDELKDKGYAYTDTIGKNGVEQAFEEYLRGTGGTKTFEMDSKGNVSLLKSKAAVQGNSVYLTIDTRLQGIAQKALTDAVQYANDYSRWMGNEYMGGDCKGAALVMLNVKDFSVICAASCPTYDLNEYYSDYEKLANDTASPMFDRAFSGGIGSRLYVQAAYCVSGFAGEKNHNRYIYRL